MTGEREPTRKYKFVFTSVRRPGAVLQLQEVRLFGLGGKRLAIRGVSNPCVPPSLDTSDGHNTFHGPALKQASCAQGRRVAPRAPASEGVSFQPRAIH